MNSNLDGVAAVASSQTASTERERLLAAARNPQTTPFDYIVIGSGAGGGTLAARLAEGGRRVLVLEAGADPAVGDAEDTAASGGDGGPSPTNALREVYAIPGYHAAATEDDPMCWSFSVRHYGVDAVQRKDPKYEPEHDPSVRGQPGHGGILYPRSSGLGGCTGHFAMIVVKPNDWDWNRIAEITGDPSWRAENMQGYFARIEDCLYYRTYGGFLRKWLLVYDALMWLPRLINPRWQLDPGGHGFSGWQKTSFIDPELIYKIAAGDRTFLRVLFDVFRFLWFRKGQLRALLGSLARFQPVQFLDPNYGTNRSGRSGRSAFIPVATDGRRRFGLRERLLSVEQAQPGGLVLLKGVLATRLVFEQGEQPPRVVGVEVEEGLHLYEASPLSGRASTASQPQQYFARREVVVAAGAFNTPQLLMLSGIGDAQHLEQMGIQGPRDRQGNLVSKVVDLPGVGRNLQDRYEVSVISEAQQPFSTLDGVSFEPGDKDDPARTKWLQTGEGLYTTNGGALAFFYQTTQASNGEPDLFIFGAPAAFRGYYWDWSKELLRATKGSKVVQRNLWSWILLKAYTRNHGGAVRLRNASARSQPEINFHSFGEGCPAPQAAADRQALVEGIEFVRDINARVSVFQKEIQPGDSIQGPGLPAFVENEAWGHHACGTCRMGTDPWRANVADLRDRDAVLDSQFRVHGVSGLRVVDASAFPEIPGYFIVTPTFMIGEKAADTLLADSASYPRQLEEAESHAIAERRQRAAGGTGRAPTPAESERLPADAVGLALSGGGVRSATYCLGVLQALAKKRRLSSVDFLSTVSGGGYIGGFLGRLYMWMSAGDPVERVQEILSDSGSDQLWWLRSHAKYLTGAGRTDLETNAGTAWRNLLSMHVCVALLILAVELLLCWIAIALDFPQPRLTLTGSGGAIPLSAWWWVPVAVLLPGLLPVWFGYWLAPTPLTTGSLSVGGLAIWLFALAGSVATLATTGTFVLPMAAIAILLLSWLWQEAALWGVSRAADRAGRGGIARSRLSRAAGIGLGALGAALLWVLIDTGAGLAAQRRSLIPVGMMGLVAATLPALRALIMQLLQYGVGKPMQPVGTGPTEQQAEGQSLLRNAALGALAFFLLGLLIFGLDVIAHWAFLVGQGTWFLLATAIASIVLGPATRFVNLSSLQSLYAGRLAHTYLGAANEDRVHSGESSETRDVDESDPRDDVLLCEYHPEAAGGPLHLINVCVNETVDVASGRQLSEDRGLPMCLGPQGVSVGLRFHALWDRLDPTHLAVGERMVRQMENPVAPADVERSALRAIRESANPDAFHVLASRKTSTVPVESLGLSRWMAISGAAISTGEGRLTNLPQSLLLGLFNVRLGYWWDSHIRAKDRPGRYPPDLWRRLKSIPGALFRTQATFLNEWRGYFPGPSHKLWYLSDGGHWENTGLYELIRRRLPFIIAVDAGHDPDYAFDDLALLTRRARLDFRAKLTWIDPTDARGTGARDWAAIHQAAGGASVPAWIQSWLQPNALGDLATLAREGAFGAALARITYDGSASESWLVVLKPCLVSPPPMALDVCNYAKANGTFPNQSTVDQFFSEDQWESYRLLGEALTNAVIA